jgi:hypothetical protein
MLMRSTILVSLAITMEYFMRVYAHANRLKRSCFAFMAHTLQARTEVCLCRRGDGVVR